jgi:hypothetical protein
LRKLLILLKDAITYSVILLAKNSHSLRESPRFFPILGWSNDMVISAGYASLRLVLGIVRLVSIGRAVCNYW